MDVKKAFHIANKLDNLNATVPSMDLHGCATQPNAATFKILSRLPARNIRPNNLTTDTDSHTYFSTF